MCLGTSLFFAFRAATPDAQALNSVLLDAKAAETLCASVELVRWRFEDIRPGLDPPMDNGRVHHKQRRLPEHGATASTPAEHANITLSWA